MREGPLGFLIKILEKVERGTAAEGKEGMARRRLILSHSRSISSSSQIGNADLASRRVVVAHLVFALHTAEQPFELGLTPL